MMNKLSSDAELGNHVLYSKNVEQLLFQLEKSTVPLICHEDNYMLPLWCDLHVREAVCRQHSPWQPDAHLQYHTHSLCHPMKLCRTVPAENYVDLQFA